MHPDFEAFVSLQGLIDVAAEIKNLEKELVKKKGALQGSQAKLQNANFVKNAAPDVVQQEHERAADLENQIRVAG